MNSVPGVMQFESNLTQYHDVQGAEGYRGCEGDLGLELSRKLLTNILCDSLLPRRQILKKQIKTRKAYYVSLENRVCAGLS